MDLTSIISIGRARTKEGIVADYIPELAKQNPNLIACGVQDNKGGIYVAGDYKDTFSLQSITKVFSLILALSRYGEEALYEKVGFQSSAQPFNTLEGLDEPPYRAPNPMLNSGAIAVTGMLGNEVAENLIEYIKTWTKYDNFFVDGQVALSEEETGYRNMAIGYLMKSRNRIEGSVEQVLREYFRQCAISTDTEGLLRLAGWMASGYRGIDESKISNDRIQRLVMAMMLTGGLYDGSTKFVANTTVPAKSGVGGGILAYKPGNYGYAVFGPALDSNGNSIGGLSMLEELVKITEGSL
ncbi:MAG: glutaminase A [Tissierellia bacterium]|nr:glutaminase A [Tissierellia bacterium]